jgi:hypothetical protein
MTEHVYPVCEVCRKAPGAGVYCSALGPVSFCYCKECGESGAEPYGVLAGMIAVMGSIEAGGEWLHDVIEASLKVAGKTRAELTADIAKAMIEMERVSGG